MLYTSNAALIFPEVEGIENAVKRCARIDRPADCKNVGPFPPDKYQLLLQKLESLYSQLAKN